MRLSWGVRSTLTVNTQWVGAPQTIDLLASFTNVDMCSRSNVEIYNRKTFKKKSFSELNQREPH